MPGRKTRPAWETRLPSIQSHCHGSKNRPVSSWHFATPPFARRVWPHQIIFCIYHISLCMYVSYVSSQLRPAMGDAMILHVHGAQLTRSGILEACFGRSDRAPRSIRCGGGCVISARLPLSDTQPCASAVHIYSASDGRYADASCHLIWLATQLSDRYLPQWQRG